MESRNLLQFQAENARKNVWKSASFCRISDRLRVLKRGTSLLLTADWSIGWTQAVSQFIVVFHVVRCSGPNLEAMKLQKRLTFRGMGFLGGGAPLQGREAT